MPKRCKIDKTVKCGYHECVPECVQFQRIGQQQLQTTDHTQDFAIKHPSTEEYLQAKATRTELEIAHKGTYFCPYCLHKDKIDKYLISTKKGYHKGLGQCPECGNKFRFSSLTSKWTPEEFAEWCYAYSADGYWQKVPFGKFSERLQKYGISQRFWRAYKEFKGEDTTESYEDWLYRQQYEDYQRQHEGEKPNGDAQQQ